MRENTFDLNHLDRVPKKVLESMLESFKLEPNDNMKQNIIPLLEQELMSRKEFDLKRLLCYQNFDQSDIRLNFDEVDTRNTNTSKVMARCHEDHVEIMVKSYLPPFRYFENFIGCINHESIHPVVDRIMLEDGHSYQDYDTEWMFYAGGMDIIDGLLYGGASPTHFLSPESVLNTMKLLPDYARNLKREYIEGDYDL